MTTSRGDADRVRDELAIATSQIAELERALREFTVKEARLRHLLSASPVIIYTADAPNYHLTYMSENVLHWFGYNAEEFISQSGFWTSCVHPEDVERVFHSLSQLSEQHHTIEYRFRHKDGRWMWVHDDFWLSRDGAGNAVELVGYWQDVTDRREAEKTIRHQAETLRQMSTPLIPISDQVVAMPLVGLMDSQRAQQVLTTLLDGIDRAGARIAILDITGVPLVDTHVASALIQSAKAAQLMGAQVVITGIRPEVAQILVALQIDLGGIVTCGTLQAGIAYAHSRTGVHAVRGS